MPAKKRPTTSTKRPDALASDPHPNSWGTLVGTLLASVSSEATAALKEYADTKISEHGPTLMKTASEKIAKTSDELMAWAKDHPVKMAAAVAALVAAGALLRAAMTSAVRREDTGERADAPAVP